MSYTQIIVKLLHTDLSRTEVATDNDVKTWWPCRVSCYRSFWRFHVFHDNDVDDGPSASDCGTYIDRHEGIRREVRLDGESGSRPLPSLRMPSSVQGLHGSK